VPTPPPTPAPTPVPTPPPVPDVTAIVTGLEPWWGELTVVDEDASLLKGVSYFAQRYLEQTSSQFVSGSPPRG
jgi:hypothetical protein